MARSTKISNPLTINWTPDPIVFGEAIMEVDAALKTTYLPLSVIKEEVQADIKERFETRTGPDGVPWKDWSEHYAPEALAYPNFDMLRRDDIMYEAVTGEDAIIVTNDTLFFNEDVIQNLPPSGGKKGGGRRAYWMQEGQEGTAHTRELPARPFLGLTTETRVFVDAAFTEWFNEALQLFPKKGGGVGMRHALRGPKGTFIPRSVALPSFMRRRR